MYACNGILFNHEGERRGETFVTRKITRAVARIVAGKQKHLYLGNLDARRDWGYAKDYVRAMWMMLQADEPADYVIGTGEAHSVREFCDVAFGLVGLDPDEYVRIDDAYFRPTEVESLQADPRKARDELGWVHETSFPDLVQFMLEHDLANEGLELDSARELLAARS